MKEAIEINIVGLKCDNPNCDYRNDDVRFEQYEQLIGCPCPSCGQSLLTREDYESCLKIKRAVGTVNTIMKAARWLKPSHYWDLLTRKG